MQSPTAAAASISAPASYVSVPILTLPPVAEKLNSLYAANRLGYRSIRAKIMGQRQYFNLPIVELERLFDDKRHNRDVLTSLVTELSHRAKPRAKKLQKRVLQALSVEKSQPMPRGEELPKGKDHSEQLLTIEEHRRVVTYLREDHGEWSDEERRVALEFAKHHEFLANLIERRSKKP